MISTSADDKTPNYTFQFKIDSDGKASPSASKATASATKPSSTKSTASSTVKVVPAGITSSPYTNGTTNGTILSTGYSNSTVVSKTSTKSSKTSATSLPTQSEASGAVAIVRSPIALVACLVGALFYLN